MDPQLQEKASHLPKIITFVAGLDPVPLAAAGGFLLLSALFSGYETAFFRLSPEEIAALGHKHRRRPWAYWLLYFSQAPQLLLSVILVGNTLANLGLTLLLFYLGRAWGPYGELLSGLLAIALIVVVGEILPKSLALSKPLFFLRAGTPWVQLVLWLSYPLGQGLEGLRSWVERRWQPGASSETLAHLIEELPPELSPPIEKRVLKNILLLRQLPVRSFMISRMDMKAVPDSLSWDELKQALSEIPYIRVPVYGKSLDEVRGILLVKDLLPHWDKAEVANWQALIRPAYFVPEGKNAYELLLEFKSRRQHVAIVVDEYGSVAGLISLQRLLEGIFGYGEEEEQSPEPLYELQPDGSVCFRAEVPLLLVQEQLGLPSDFFAEESVRNAENLAEFLLSLAERIPAPGEVLTYRNYAFEVVESTPHRIERVRAYALLSGEPSAPPENLPSLDAS